jgi:aspartokinase/homoserine dehydrogenase 1
VHKFGGASLNDADLYKTCGDLLISQSNQGGHIPTAAVVSAAGGMTDALVSVMTVAVDDQADAQQKLQAAVDRQMGILLELVPGRPELTDPVCANLEKDQKGVKAMLLAAAQMRGVPPQMLELVAGLGEVWSAQTLAAYLKSTGVPSEWVDARDILIVPDGSGSGLGEKGQAMDTIEPLWDTTINKLQAWWEKAFDSKDASAPYLVITGFICSTVSGTPSTLKRSGSDYSATIFAKVLGAASVTFWKNVNGVYTADPRRVKEAFPIANMTFDEAMELAYFGGQVLHPSAMVPCIEKRIPVLVRNVFDPSHPGTRVYGRGDALLKWDDQDDFIKDDEQMPVTAITSIEKVSLVTIAGTSFLGTHGVAKRMMEALSNAGVNVILTSQGSSEHSITVAVDAGEGQLALDSVSSAFELEIARNAETRATKKDGLSIIAVIGEGMKNTTGISGRFFNALGRAKVNVAAIAQGSSERNISAVVGRADLSRGLIAAHAGFTLSSTAVTVGIIGTGMVGTELIQQLANFASGPGRNKDMPAMAEVNYLNIETSAVCDMNKMLLGQKGIPLGAIGTDGYQQGAGGSFFDIDSWGKSLQESGRKLEDVFKVDTEMRDTDIDAMVDFLDAKDVPHKVIIDCTASDEVASKYSSWLRRGLHIISPNKRAGAGPLLRYQDILKEVGMGRGQFHYESAVGAQLPVISLVRDLLVTGDNISQISGILSGSLSFIFNTLDREPDMAFSEAVELARQRGLTEPDPEQDLSGKDTARKGLILARELGLKLEFEDIQIEPMLAGGSWADDATRAQVDQAIKSRMKAAAAEGMRLFYVCEVDVETSRVFVGLRGYSRENPPFALKDAEVVLQVKSERFREPTPLVVRGPGAGAEVTASGVFASLLRLLKTLS